MLVDTILNIGSLAQRAKDKKTRRVAVGWRDVRAAGEQHAYVACFDPEDYAEMNGQLLP